MHCPAVNEESSESLFENRSENASMQWARHWANFVADSIWVVVGKSAFSLARVKLTRSKNPKAKSGEIMTSVVRKSKKSENNQRALFFGGVLYRKKKGRWRQTIKTQDSGHGTDVRGQWWKERDDEVRTWMKNGRMIKVRAGRKWRYRAIWMRFGGPFSDCE